MNSRNWWMLAIISGAASLVILLSVFTATVATPSASALADGIYLVRDGEVGRVLVDYTHGTYGDVSLPAGGVVEVEAVTTVGRVDENMVVVTDSSGDWHVLKAVSELGLNERATKSFNDRQALDEHLRSMQATRPSMNPVSSMYTKWSPWAVVAIAGALVLFIVFVLSLWAIRRRRGTSER